MGVLVFSFPVRMAQRLPSSRLYVPSDAGHAPPWFQPGTPSSVSRRISQELKDVYAPENFDAASTVLACGFPGGTSVATCRNFLGWVGPVIYVERGPSLGTEANFIVVSASDEWAHLATRQPLYYDAHGTAIVCRLVDRRPTAWDAWVPSWMKATPALRPARATPVVAGPNPDSVMAAWSAMARSPNATSMGQTLSQLGTQLAGRAEQGYAQASSFVSQQFQQPGPPH